MKKLLYKVAWGRLIAAVVLGLAFHNVMLAVATLLLLGEIDKIVNS